jgi:hypothetical protein
MPDLYWASGSIDRLAIAHDVLIAGGSFVQSYGPDDLIAVDVKTGAYVPGWDCPAGTIHDLAYDARTDQLFVAGFFTQIGANATPRNYLAAIDPRTSAVLPFDAHASAHVYELDVDGGTLRLGGTFQTIGGTTRPRFAEVDSRTAALGAFDLQVGGAGTTEVVTLRRFGPVLLVGGRFDNLLGKYRPNLALLDAESRKLLDWNPAPNGEIHEAVFHRDKLYVAGEFHVIAGRPRTGFAVFPLQQTRDAERRELALDRGLLLGEEPPLERRLLRAADEPLELALRLGGGPLLDEPPVAAEHGAGAPRAGRAVHEHGLPVAARAVDRGDGARDRRRAAGAVAGHREVRDLDAELARGGLFRDLVRRLVALLQVDDDADAVLDERGAHEAAVELPAAVDRPRRDDGEALRDEAVLQVDRVGLPSEERGRGEQRDARADRDDPPRRARRHAAVAPPQLEPAPAVQPKQCGSTWIARPSRSASVTSKIVFGSSISSIWLKSQS